MPLVTYDEVQPFLPLGLHADLSSLNVFEPYEAEAAKLVASETGITIPADADDAPDWCVLPMAFLIENLASKIMTSKSEEFQAELDKDWDRAMELIRDQIPKDAEIVIAAQDTITGVNTW